MTKDQLQIVKDADACSEDLDEWQQGFIGDLMDLKTGGLMLLGPTMDPRVAYEISLRLPHLGLRMAEHSRRALAFCTRLRDLGQPAIYPGLADHRFHNCHGQNNGR